MRIYLEVIWSLRQQQQECLHSGKPAQAENFGSEPRISWQLSGHDSAALPGGSCCVNCAGKVDQVQPTIKSCVPFVSVSFHKYIFPRIQLTLLFRSLVSY